MNPEEKAEELVNKFKIITYSYQPYAGARYEVEEIGEEAGKKCALLAVDEILNIITGIYDYDFEKLNPYWQEVKQEINKL